MTADFFSFDHSPHLVALLKEATTQANARCDGAFPSYYLAYCEEIDERIIGLSQIDAGKVLNFVTQFYGYLPMPERELKHFP